MTVEFHRDGPWELPEGWVWARLGDVCQGPQYGWTTSASQTGRLKLLRTTDISNGRCDWSTVPACRTEPDEPEKYLLEDGDIVISRAGSVGKSFIIENPERAVFASYLVRFKPRIEPRYVYWFLQSSAYWKQITEKTAGIAIPNVNASKLRDVHIPIAPAAEQRRIVVRIDELFTEIADGETALARARDDLGTWRRALLKAAVTGELTREWREDHVSNETGAEVLARVKKARVGYKTTKAKTRKVIVEEIDEDALYEIPKSWAWASLGELGDIVGGVTVDKKRRPNDPVTAPYLRVANVQRGRLDLTEVKTIAVERSTAAALRLEAGDILLNEGGDRDKIGRGWVWNGEVDNCIHQNHVFRVRLFDSSVNPYFVSHYANEMGRRFFVEKGKQTTNLASISMSKISQLRIPVPPVSEMKEAMRLLDEGLIATADVEAELVAGSISGAARQSILKTAFEGRLVEQDPRDEPADRLLKRMSEQDETTPPARRTRRRRTAVAAE